MNNKEKMVTRKQGIAYFKKKVLHFLTHSLVIVPINTDKFQNIADENVKFYPEMMHDINSLKLKFQELSKLTGPSGNPNSSDEVQKTKKL